MRRIDFLLHGKTPLLMHADDVQKADSLTEWRKAPENKNLSRAGDDRSPAWTWQTYLYSDDQHVTIPCDNLMVCLRRAGAQITMKKQKTFKEVSQSGMLVEREFLTLFVGGSRLDGSRLRPTKEKSFEAQAEEAGGKRLAMSEVVAARGLPFKEQSQWAEEHGFRLFVKRAAVGKAKHIRVRPRFDVWTVCGTLVVRSEELTDDVVDKMLGLAGDVGLGDWRPGCKTPGSYGMFQAFTSRAE